jgi:hypothetical protein
MSDYLNQLAARALESESPIQPWVPSRFESVGGLIQTAQEPGELGSTLEEFDEITNDHSIEQLPNSAASQPAQETKSETISLATPFKKPDPYTNTGRIPHTERTIDSDGVDETSKELHLGNSSSVSSAQSVEPAMTIPFIQSILPSQHTEEQISSAPQHTRSETRDDIVEDVPLEGETQPVPMPIRGLPVVSVAPLIQPTHQSQATEEQTPSVPQQVQSAIRNNPVENIHLEDETQSVPMSVSRGMPVATVPPLIRSTHQPQATEEQTPSALQQVRSAIWEDMVEDVHPEGEIQPVPMSVSRGMPVATVAPLMQQSYLPQVPEEQTASAPHVAPQEVKSQKVESLIDHLTTRQIISLEPTRISSIAGVEPYEGVVSSPHPLQKRSTTLPVRSEIEAASEEKSSWLRPTIAPSIPLMEVSEQAVESPNTIRNTLPVPRVGNSIQPDSSGYSKRTEHIQNNITRNVERKLHQPLAETVLNGVEPHLSAHYERDSKKRERVDAEPTIHISIGRIDVRAIPVAESKPLRQRKQQPTMGLDEYLRHRDEGGRR